MTTDLIQTLRKRFPGYPGQLVEEVALATMDAMKGRADGALRFDGKDNHQAARDRDQARRDHAAHEITQMWKRGAAR